VADGIRRGACTFQQVLMAAAVAPGSVGTPGRKRGKQSALPERL